MHGVPHAHAPVNIRTFPHSPNLPSLLVSSAVTGGPSIQSNTVVLTGASAFGLEGVGYGGGGAMGGGSSPAYINVGAAGLQGLEQVSASLLQVGFPPSVRR